MTPTEIYGEALRKYGHGRTLSHPTACQAVFEAGKVEMASAGQRSIAEARLDLLKSTIPALEIEAGDAALLLSIIDRGVPVASGGMSEAQITKCAEEIAERAVVMREVHPLMEYEAALDMVTAKSILRTHLSAGKESGCRLTESEVVELIKTCAFFSSVIKCGEKFTSTCEKHMDRVHEIATKLASAPKEEL